MRNELNKIWTISFIVTFCCLFAEKNTAQSAPNNTSIITLDSIDKVYHLSDYFKIFKATEKEYAIKEVAHPAFDTNFIFPTTLALEEGFTYWGKVMIKNELSSSNATTRWILALDWVNEDTEIFTQNKMGGITTVKRTGNVIPRSKKSDLYFSNFFYASKVQLNFPMGESTTLYLKLNDHPGRHISNFDCTLSRLSPDEFNTQTFRLGFLCLFFGMVSIMAIYSFILYFFVKDKSYLFYALYLVSIFLFHFYAFGFIKTQATWLFPNNLMLTYAFSTLKYWIVIFYVAFISSFLNLKKNLPFWYKTFQVIIYIGMVSFVIDNIFLYLNNYTETVSLLLTAIYLTILLLTTPIFFYQLYKIKLPQGYFILLGVSAMMFGAASLIPSMIAGSFETEGLFRLQGGIIVEIIIFSLGLSYHQRKKEREAQQNLERERAHKALQKLSAENEALLLNVLPVDVANELRKDGKSKARYYEHLTVLFTDFVNFTTFSENSSPADLVAELDYLFSSFDEIIQQYGIEKIKTIGDAYLCTGGLTTSNSQINEVIQAAIDIRNFIEAYKKTAQSKGLPSMDIRLGIHIGPAIGGVVGNKKFAFDIWGDTVNVAARMESHSEIGKINVSQAIRDNAASELFHFEHRGKMEVKNKGLMDMYFVELT